MSNIEMFINSHNGSQKQFETKAVFITALSTIKKLLIIERSKARKSRKILSISDTKQHHNFLMHWLLLLFLIIIN